MCSQQETGKERWAERAQHISETFFNQKQRTHERLIHKSSIWFTIRKKKEKKLQIAANLVTYSQVKITSNFLFDVTQSFKSTFT